MTFSDCSFGSFANATRTARSASGSLCLRSFDRLRMQLIAALTQEPLRTGTQQVPVVLPVVSGKRHRGEGGQSGIGADRVKGFRDSFERDAIVHFVYVAARDVLLQFLEVVSIVFPGYGGLDQDACGNSRRFVAGIQDPSYNRFGSRFLHQTGHFQPGFAASYYQHYAGTKEEKFRKPYRIRMFRFQSFDPVLQLVGKMPEPPVACSRNTLLQALERTLTGRYLFVYAKG